MNIKPIRTEADYLWGLEEINKLWEEAEPGTAEGDRFEVLSVLVDDYERKHHPISITEKISNEPISSGFGKVPVIYVELGEDDEDTLVSQRNPEITKELIKNSNKVISEQIFSSKNSPKTQNVQETKKKINYFNFNLFKFGYMVLLFLGIGLLFLIQYKLYYWR